MAAAAAAASSSRWTTAMAIFMVSMGFFAASSAAEIKLKHSDGNQFYNHTLAKILVEYASAVYITDLSALYTWTCSRCNGKTKGFEVIELIVDVENCLQAFVGVAPDPNSIIIAFRGTQKYSVSNWIEDLFWKQLDVNYPGMPDAMVHHGFYSAYHNTSMRPEILNAVQWARKVYGNLAITVVGHSLGGALAAFCALDLAVNYGAEQIQLMTFGQPRIGNPAFAAYFNKHIPNAIRVTHQNDIVPHLPPYYSFFREWTYHHFSREVWLYEAEKGNLASLVEKICDGSGEDSTCSRSVYGNSIADHLEYYNVTLHSDTRGSCEFVFAENTAEHNAILGESIILSRYPRAQSFVESS